ncbi:hypothetical protein HDU96_009974 [Phlyctochytrium bullatum]|nr:hypothetical protein HDU96_009974 [Phlyctochytrium bullatum]
MPPAILPALSTPTLGQQSFPNELLRCILLHVLPKDLPTVAAANRHLRSAVAACIDPNLARHHLSQTSSRKRLEPGHGPYEYESLDPDGPQEYHLFRIPFDHPLLRFHHSVAALCRHGINKHVAYQMWGNTSEYQVWENGGRHIVSLKANALCAKRVQALRAAVHIRFRGDRPNNISFTLDEEISALADAMDIAVLMNSVELLQDIHSSLPEAISEDLESDTMIRYFHTCAKVGHLEGLALVPSNHSLLISDYGLLRSAHNGRNLSAMQLVLEKGAVVNQAVAQTLRLTFLQGESDCQILRLLFKYGFDPNWLSLECNALEELARDVAYDCMKAFLEHGGDPNARDEDGKTALDYIALSTTFGRKAECKSLPLLIKAGANIDEIDPSRSRPALSTACEPVRINWEFIEILLDAGASLNVTCRVPPLRVAVRKRNKKLVKRFLDAGADVNFPNEDGRTPLHFALGDPRMFKEVEVPLLLLEAGADPTIRCNANYTPLDELEPEDIEWTPETLRLFDALVEHGAELDDAWKNAFAAAVRGVGKAARSEDV